MCAKMYELIQLEGNSYYIESPAKIGLVRPNEKEVCLIDSGNDKETGRRVRKIIDEKGWKLISIYNTHSHADHIGGNKYLQSNTGCSLYAPGIEGCLTRYPVLEPAYLYGGCPPKQLRHKFLMAQESDALPLTEEALPDGFELLRLPGHSLEMVGFRSPDDVVYLADSLLSRETLEKYKISFLYDVPSYIATLELLTTLEARFFVPAHAAVTKNIAPLARYNLEKTNEVAEKLIELCSEPICFEELLRRLFNDYDLTLSLEQYVLTGSTIKSYLAWLSDTGRVEFSFENNRMLWRRRG